MYKFVKKLVGFTMLDYLSVGNFHMHQAGCPLDGEEEDESGHEDDQGRCWRERGYIWTGIGSPVPCLPFDSFGETTSGVWAC